MARAARAASPALTVFAALAALVLLAPGACTEGADEQVTKRWLTRSLLELADARDPATPHVSAEREAALKKLRALISRAQSALARTPDAHPVELLNHLLFIEEDLLRVVKNPPPESMLLTHVLSHGQGSCLGLSGLYLALGEQLGLPLSGVLVPGHFLVRYHGPRGDRTIELLRQGEQMPSNWYRQKYGAPAHHPLYFHNLSPRQTVAVFHYNLANEQRERGRYPEAIKIYQAVVAELPQFAEAQANLGLCYHRQGQLTAARLAYQRAQAAHPALPGLAQNMEALAREREARSKAMPAENPYHAHE